MFTCIYPVSQLKKNRIKKSTVCLGIVGINYFSILANTTTKTGFVDNNDTHYVFQLDSESS